MNPVVLDASAIGQKGWLVHLVNPAVKDGELVIGGHVRVRVSADGKTVLEATRLSQSCRTFEPDDAPGSRVAAFR